VWKSVAAIESTSWHGLLDLSLARLWSRQDLQRVLDDEPCADTPVLNLEGACHPSKACADRDVIADQGAIPHGHLEAA